MKRKRTNQSGSCQWLRMLQGHQYSLWLILVQYIGALTSNDWTIHIFCKFPLPNKRYSCWPTAIPRQLYRRVSCLSDIQRKSNQGLNITSTKDVTKEVTASGSSNAPNPSYSSVDTPTWVVHSDNKDVVWGGRQIMRLLNCGRLGIGEKNYVAFVSVTMKLVVTLCCLSTPNQR